MTLNEIGNERMVAIKITPQDSRPMFVLNIYMPSGNYSYEEYFSSVSEMTEIYANLRQYGHVIIELRQISTRKF